MRVSSIAALLVVLSRLCHAVPPLVSGDAPTAVKGHLEIYSGAQYEDGPGGVERELPTTEFVYGLFKRQELTFEIPYLSLTPGSGAPARGFGDGTVGTKVLALEAAPDAPAVAVSFETKLDNGSRRKSLGSGAKDYDVRARAQKAWGVFSGIANLGRTFVGDGGSDDRRRDVWFGSLAEFYDLTENFALLSEVYWQNSDAPGEPNRLAGDAGFQVSATRRLQLQFSAGKSLREGNLGGPHLRLYAGLHLEFAVAGE